MRQLAIQLIKWFKMFTNGDASYQNPEERQRRLLTNFIKAFGLAAILAYSLPVLFNSYTPQPIDLINIFLATVALAFVYWLGRWGHLKLSALIFVLSLSFLIQLSAFLSTTPSAQYILYYLVIPTLITNIFLSSLWTWAILIINLIVMLLGERTSEIIHFDDLPGLFLSISTVMIVLIARHRDQLEQDRQRELVASEARYYQLFRTIHDAIIIHQDGIIRMVNPAFEILFGKTQGEVADKHISTLLTGDEYEPIFEAFQGSEDGNPTIDFKVMRSDGMVLYVELRSAPLVLNNQAYTVTSIRDVTARQEATERQFELDIQNERLMIIRRFLNDISHDLRTPLTVIISSTELLERARDDQRRQHHIQTIKTHVNHLWGAIENLLTTARLDNPTEHTFSIRLAAIAPTVIAAVEEQRKAAVAQGLHLHLVPIPELPDVLLDSEELQSAIRQLLLNAIQFTPPGGYITVFTDFIDDKLVIGVSDTGVGIPEAEQDKIFEMFYRVDKARNTETGRIGLGLAIVKRIVEAHAGDVHVRSTPGAGSTFFICLPNPRSAATSA